MDGFVVSFHRLQLQPQGCACRFVADAVYTILFCYTIYRSLRSLSLFLVLVVKNDRLSGRSYITNKRKELSKGFEPVRIKLLKSFVGTYNLVR